MKRSRTPTEVLGIKGLKPGKAKHSGTATTLNADRGRPMVTLTLSPAGLVELDTQRGVLSRGAYVELLLECSRKPRATTPADIDALFAPVRAMRKALKKKL